MSINFYFYRCKVLPESEYTHFLQLYAAVRICSSNLYKEHQPIATKMFKTYVKNYETLYGRHSIGSNVHNLIHVTEDMINCNVGNLIDISIYKYENSLRILKLMLQHSNRPLEQVVRRIVEKETSEKLSEKTNLFDPKPFIPKTFYETHYHNCTIYKKIELEPNVILSSRKFDIRNRNFSFKGNDSCFITKTNEIIKMLFVRKSALEFKIYGLRVKEKRAFFVHPIESTKLDIYVLLDIYVSDGAMENGMCVHSLDSIKAKMMCIVLSYSFHTDFAFFV